MSLMFRYLALGISVALLAIGLARIIASAFDFSWLVISIILLALLTLTILFQNDSRYREWPNHTSSRTLRLQPALVGPTACVT